MNRKFHLIPLLLQILSLFESASPNRTHGGCSRFKESDFFSRPRTMKYEWVHHRDEPVPQSFDARKKWPKCPSISEARDQEECGACWAFAVTSMLSDRLCIHTKGRVKFKFAPQELLTCCNKCYAGARRGESRCDGGHTEEAVEYMVKHGGRSEACKSYNPELVDRTTVGQKKCQKTCTSKSYKVPYEKDKRSAKKYLLWWRHQHRSNLKQIQIEIMKNGPVVADMDAIEHFERYFDNPAHSTHIYDKIGKYSNPVRHSIRVIGWGVEKGVPYWLLANSWGKQWGNRGFCKIVRGQNWLDIETSFVVASFEGKSPKTAAFSKAGDRWEASICLGLQGACWLMSFAIGRLRLAYLSI